MFKFRLRTLLIVVTLLAIGSGIYAWRLHQQRMIAEAIETIKKQGGKLVQDEKTSEVLRVYLSGPVFDDTRLEQLVGHMRYLPSLNELDLVRTKATDKSVEPLSSLKQLKEIYVFETPISEQGIKTLRELLPDVAIKLEEPEPVASSMMSMKIYRHAITALASSSNQNNIAIGNGAGEVVQWDSNSQEMIDSWKAHEQWVFDIAYSPDGSKIATGGDNVVKLWNAHDKSLLHTFSGPKNDVHDVVFTPDGKFLIAASDDRLIRMWDVESHELVQTLSGHRRQIPRMALSTNGTRLASASRDETVRLWSIPDGNPLAVLTGHHADVMAVTFDSSDNILATGDQQGLVCLWHADTQALIREFESSLGSIFDLAFDPDGESLTAVGAHGIQRWDLLSGISHRSEQPYVSRLLFSESGNCLWATNIEGQLKMLNSVSLATENVVNTMYGRRGLDPVVEEVATHDD